MEISIKYQEHNAILRISGDILGNDRLMLNEKIQELLDSGSKNIVLKACFKFLLKFVDTFGWKDGGRRAFHSAGLRIEFIEISKPSILPFFRTVTYFLKHAL